MVRIGLWTILSWLVAVSINSLLNLMDAVTYGRLFFPTQDASFADLDIAAICMYLFSTSTSQLLISLLSSFPRGATACAIIENIPFFHSISLHLAHSKTISPDGVLPTILMAYCCISLTTSLLFLLFVLLDLDRLVQKFPRTVLVGSMGGIGIFLVLTAFEMVIGGGKLNSSRIPLLFQNWNVLGIWSIGLSLSLLALFLEVRFGLLFVTPIISAITVILFYSIVAFLPYGLAELRSMGWLMGGKGEGLRGKIDPFEIYSRFSLQKVQLRGLWQVLPTIIGAALFGALHVPLNVPSFARLARQSFSMRQELLTQCASNFATAFIGFVPNYFVYTNSLLFLRAGGTHRIAGVLLAISTASTLFGGLFILDYVPTLIVLFLTFYLGIYLIYEALFRSYPLCTRWEYLVICGTILSMQVFGFVPGICLGLCAALSHAALQVVRSIRRQSRMADPPMVPLLQSPPFEASLHYVQQWCRHLKLEGYLWFGNSVEHIHLIERTPINICFLIIDFTECTGMDLNICESLLAISTEDLLEVKHLMLVGLQGPLGDFMRKSCRRPTLRLCDNMQECHLQFRQDLWRILGDRNESNRQIDHEDARLLPPQDLFIPTQVHSHHNEVRLLEEEIINGGLQGLDGDKGDSIPLLRFRRGEALYGRDTNGVGIFIIRSGKVLYRGEDGAMYFFGVGSWLGLQRALRGQACFTGCTACADTTGLFININLLDTSVSAQLQLLCHYQLINLE